MKIEKQFSLQLINYDIIIDATKIKKHGTIFAGNSK